MNKIRFPSPMEFRLDGTTTIGVRKRIQTLAYLSTVNDITCCETGSILVTLDGGGVTLQLNDFTNNSLFSNTNDFVHKGARPEEMKHINIKT